MSTAEGKIEEALHSVPELPAELRNLSLKELERIAVIRTLRSVQGSREKTATILGVSLRKVQYSIKKYKAEGFLGANE